MPEHREELVLTSVSLAEPLLLTPLLDRVGRLTRDDLQDPKAVFEQRCYGVTGALRGQVHIVR